MSLPLAQPAEVLRAWQKDELYRARLAAALARALPRAAPAAPPALAALLYAGATTLRDLQTLGEEYSGLLQVDGSLARLPARAARALSTLLSLGGAALLQGLLAALERRLRARPDLTPQATSVFLLCLRTLRESIPQLESIHRALCYIYGGPIQIGKAVAGIDYVQARPAAAAYYAHLRLLGLVTVAHAMLSCGQNVYRVKQTMEESSTHCNEVETSKTCVACLEELGQPCALPCGHVFCLQCCYGALESCALCRTTFTRNTVVPLQNYSPGS